MIPRSVQGFKNLIPEVQVFVTLVSGIWHFRNCCFQMHFKFSLLFTITFPIPFNSCIKIFTLELVNQLRQQNDLSTKKKLIKEKAPPSWPTMNFHIFHFSNKLYTILSPWKHLLTEIKIMQMWAFECSFPPSPISVAQIRYACHEGC